MLYDARNIALAEARELLTKGKQDTTVSIQEQEGKEEEEQQQQQRQQGTEHEDDVVLATLAMKEVNCTLNISQLRNVLYIYSRLAISYPISIKLFMSLRRKT